MSAVSTLAAFGLEVRAGGTRVLVVPTDDGYGLSDCLTQNASCGPMVASAWCQANGQGRSGTLGAAGAAPTATDAVLRPGPRGFAITCHD